VRRVVDALLVIGLFIAAGCSCDGPAVEMDRPHLSASLEPDSAGLGDPVRLRIEAVIPAGAVPEFPGEGDSIGAWKILNAGVIDEQGNGPWRRSVREITVTGFRLGWIGPDSLRLSVVTAEGESLRLACEAPGLRIGGELVDSANIDPASVRDIRDVVSTGAPRWPWYAAGAALIIAALLFLNRMLRAKKRRILHETDEVGPSPEEEFETAIARLLSEELLERGLYREFYYGVSSAVRLYLERIHRLPLLESTSVEVLDLLRPRIRIESEREALDEWLREGDLVKYARMERLQAEAVHYLERSRELVKLLARSPAGEKVDAPDSADETDRAPARVAP